jgi:hypothetical protein
MLLFLMILAREMTTFTPQLHHILIQEALETSFYTTARQQR